MCIYSQYSISLWCFTKHCWSFSIHKCKPQTEHLIRLVSALIGEVLPFLLHKLCIITFIYFYRPMTKLKIQSFQLHKFTTPWTTLAFPGLEISNQLFGQVHPKREIISFVSAYLSMLCWKYFTLQYVSIEEC